MYVYPKLREAQARAKSLGLPIPRSSQRAGKKLYVFNGRIIHFGNRDYDDYLIHGDEDRRRNYRTRARGIIGASGRPAYKDKSSPAFYAYNILW